MPLGTSLAAVGRETVRQGGEGLRHVHDAHEGWWLVQGAALTVACKQAVRGA